MEVPGRRFDLQGCDDASNSGQMIYCEPCEENDRQHVALAYCADCNEFICAACERTHRGSKISRQHKILDQTTMPKQKLSSADGTFCPKHGGKFLEYYCKTHGEFACGVCVNLFHRQCESIDLVKDAATGYENSQDYKNLVLKMQELAKSLKENIVTADETRINIEKQFGMSLFNIKAFRKELDSILDSLEETIITEAETLKENYLKLNVTTTESFKSMESEINSISSDIETGIKYKQGQQFLIAAKTAEKQVGEFKRKVINLAGDRKLVFKTFKPDDKLVTLLKSVKALGRLEECKALVNQPNTKERNTEKTGTPPPSDTGPKKEETGTKDKIFEQNADKKTGVLESKKQSNARGKDPSRWKASFVDEIHLHLKQDKCKCYITSGLDMTDGTLILIDNGNSCLKHVDPVRKEVRVLITLPCKPWDIILYKGHQYVVSSENKLVFLNIDGKVCIDREMQVDGDCRGIAFDIDKFIIACPVPSPCVRIINVDGQVLRVIQHDDNGQLLFLNPWYVRISPDRKSFLVSDFEKHRVTSLTVNGDVVSCYADGSLKGPTGMAVDDKGVVFLAGRKSHNLHIMTAECQPVQVLIQRRAGEELPQSVVWCRNQNKLFVSHNWRTRMCNKLSVYNIQ